MSDFLDCINSITMLEYDQVYLRIVITDVFGQLLSLTGVSDQLCLGDAFPSLLAQLLKLAYLGFMKSVVTDVVNAVYCTLLHYGHDYYVITTGLEMTTNQPLQARKIEMYHPSPSAIEKITNHIMDVYM